jgi:hypothetical protein
VTKSDKNHLGFLADFSSVTTENIKSVLQTIPSGQSEVDISDERRLRFQGLVKTNILN